MLYQLMQLRKQSRTILDIVLLTLQRDTWYAFSKNIFLTKLRTENEIERREGIQRIFQILKIDVKEILEINQFESEKRLNSISQLQI